LLSEAIERYHRLVEQEIAADPTWAVEFGQSQIQARLTFGGRPLTQALRPNFISAAQNRSIREVCTVLRSCVIKVKEAIARIPGFVHQLGLTPGELMLAEIDPGYHRYAVSARFDGFLTGDTLQLIELNAESPAGVAYADLLARVYLKTAPMTRFQADYQVIPPFGRETLLRSLLETYYDWGGTGLPRIAIVDWEGLPTATEFELFQEFFAAAGLSALIADPRQLEYDQRGLSCGGAPIDLVYRRVATNELLEKLDQCQALVGAYRDHKVCVVNSFRAKYVHKKMLFAILTDYSNARLFDASERAMIERHLPWTRRVAPLRTLYRGRSVDLPEFILRHREQLVLKPNDEYGGRGVVIGWEVGADEWERRVSAALEDFWVVQERVGGELQRFAIWDSGLRYQDYLIDLDPFLFAGEVGGCLARLGVGATTNVSTGGGLVPTFLVRRRER
jgi:uncharacterized circularly permuted ATP-grasp superfamily protein